MEFITYNVQGLRDNKKCAEVFHYLHVKCYDVIFLQETHSIKKDEKLWSS